MIITPHSFTAILRSFKLRILINGDVTLRMVKKYFKSISYLHPPKKGKNSPVHKYINQWAERFGTPHFLHLYARSSSSM